MPAGRFSPKSVSYVLKPGGFLVLNTLNGDGTKLLLAKLISNGSEFEKNVFMIEKSSLDPKKMRTSSVWKIIDARKGRTKIFRGSSSQNVYTHKQMKQMLKTAGFKVKTTWGKLQGGDFDEKTSWHQTILAQKVRK